MKKFLKSAILETVKQRNKFSPVWFDRTLLDFLRIGFEPPTSAEAKYPNGARAVCVISLDFDHLTKTLRPGSPRWFPKRVESLLVKNRIGTRNMLGVSEKYSIPMTWAICGQTAEEDPETFNSIRRSKVEQEIGAHTYSHVDVSSCNADELKEEVQKCLRVLQLPEHPRTFIFPWNRLGHLEQLAQMGFITYRDQMRSIGAPKEHLGLLNIPPTYYVDVKSYKAHNLMKKYLDVCISWNSVFHLWMHPWSVVLEGDDRRRFVKDTIDPLFSYIEQKRNEGVLTVQTMGDLATFYRSNNQTPSHISKTETVHK